MKQNIRMIYSILAFCCAVFLVSCDVTTFPVIETDTAPAEDPNNDIEGSSDVYSDKDDNDGSTGTGSTSTSTDSSGSTTGTSTTTSTGTTGTTGTTTTTTTTTTDSNEKNPDLEYVRTHPEVQRGKQVKVCIAFRGITEHRCNAAKFAVFFNDNVSYSHLNLDNYTSREVTTISGKKVKIIGGSNVPGTEYTAYWSKDGGLGVTLKCKSGQVWKSHRCHVGIASVSIVGEVQVRDGSRKYISAELLQFKSENETKKFINFTDLVDGKTIGNARFRLSDFKYDFDDYCALR